MWFEFFWSLFSLLFLLLFWHMLSFNTSTICWGRLSFSIKLPWYLQQNLSVAPFLDSIQLVYVYTFPLESYCLDYCNFIFSIEIRQFVPLYQKHFRFPDFCLSFHITLTSAFHHLYKLLLGFWLELINLRRNGILMVSVQIYWHSIFFQSFRFSSSSSICVL